MERARALAFVALCKLVRLDPSIFPMVYKVRVADSPIQIQLLTLELLRRLRVQLTYSHR